MDNRFLRCVAEHRASLGKPEFKIENRFTRLVAEERGYIPAIEMRPYTVSETPTRIYYSPKTTEDKRTDSFLERYKAAMRPTHPTHPTSPQILPTSQTPTPLSSPLLRKRLESVLSITSEESFPSLSSGTTTNSPIMKGWSDALRKNLIEDGMLCKPKLRVKSEAHEHIGVEEEELVFDEDGFPHMRIVSLAKN